MSSTDDTRRNISVLFASNMIRYTVLNTLIRDNFANVSAKEINLYIDLYPLYKTIARTPESYTLSYTEGSINEMVANLMNLVTHYKRFFRNDVKCRVFIISRFGLNPDIKKIEMEYNQNFLNNISCKSNVFTFISKFENNCTALFKYVSDVYFIPTRYEFGASVTALKYKYPGIPNIVISRDDFNLQLIAHQPDIVILRPMKEKDKDISFAMNLQNTNFWELYCKIRKVKYKPEYESISPLHIKTVNSACRVPERDLKGLYHIDSVLGRLLDRSLSFPPEQHFIVLNRSKAVDINFHTQLYMSSSEYFLLSNLLIDFSNKEQLVEYIHHVLDKICPIDLENL